VTSKWHVALLGSAGITCIVFGLIGAHGRLPVSLSVEAVYNGFAILSWPLFVLLNLKWSKQFTERPARFNLACHFAMAVMVCGRFATYPGDFTVTLAGAAFVALAIAGYVLFNISIKLSAGHRATNVTMNLGGGFVLMMMSVLSGNGGWGKLEPLGILLGGASIFRIVLFLGKSYGALGKINKASLVPPLVYDGILVLAPAIALVTREEMSLSGSILLGLGMIAITALRWRHSNRPL
jgi:hypothetical protein